MPLRFPFLRLPSYPLLAKELIEQAGKRRTYIVRCSLALIMLAAFLIAYDGLVRPMDQIPGMNQMQWAQATGHASPDMLGHGRMLFNLLYRYLTVAIILMMPFITSISLTREKEQGSLTTLLLTPMSAWEILSQKYISGLVVVGSFILLAMPLLVICYAIGGLDTDRIVIAAYLLMLTCVQVGAICLAASSCCRTSIVAICTSIVVILVLYGAQPLVMRLSSGHGFLPYPSPYGQLQWNAPNQSLFPSMCPYFSYLLQDRINDFHSYYSTFMAGMPQLGQPLTSGGSFGNFQNIFKNSLPALASTVFFLIVARIALVKRAEIKGASPVLRGMLILDRWFIAIDQRMGRKAVRDLPWQRPVYWRELNRRSLANWRYLCRIFIPLAVVLLFLMFSISTSSVGQRNANLTFLVDLIPCIASLFLLILGTGILARERAEQSLEVLLSSPITIRDVIRQKVRSFKRIQGAFLVLMLMSFGVRWMFIPGADGSAFTNGCCYLVIGMFLCQAMLWLGILSGMIFRSRVSAVIGALVASGLWLEILPRMMLTLSHPPLGQYQSWSSTWIALHMSPVFTLTSREAETISNVYVYGTAANAPAFEAFLQPAMATGACLVVSLLARCSTMYWGERLSLRRPLHELSVKA